MLVKIQHRRGDYNDFDPTRLDAGEVAVTQANDPNSPDGKAVYVAITNGNVKQLATVEDMESEVETAINAAAAEVVAEAEDAADRAETAAATFETDPTFSIEGKAADAKATGTSLNTLANGITSAHNRLDTLVDNTLSQTGKAADAKVTGDRLTAVDMSDRLAKGKRNNQVQTGAVIIGDITNNVASNEYATVIGTNNQATGRWSFAQGNGSKATADYSVAEGNGTTAAASSSHSEGYGTIANRAYQRVFGKYNEAETFNTQYTQGEYVEIVGNGSFNHRSNARTLDWNGNEVLAGKMTVGAQATNNMDVPTKGYVDGAVSTVSGNVSTLQGQMATAQGNISTLQGDMTTAQGNISTLQGQMTTAQEDIGALQDDVSDLDEAKASVDGIYPNLTAGTAEQLLSDTGIEDSTPYFLRRSKAGSREYDEIVGGSIVYNQGTRFASSKIPSARSGLTFTSANNETACSISGTTESPYMNALGWFGLGDEWNPSSRTGHAILMRTSLLEGTSSNGTLRFNGGGVNELHVGDDSIFRSNGSRIGIRAEAGDVFNNFTFSGICVDLTQMFGSAVADHIYSLEQSTAGAGVALFKEIFGSGYLPYNAGELMSVSGVSAHVMTGFNQWDEQWEVGALAWATGAEITSANSRRTDFIPVWEGESYYLKAPYGSGCVWYDANKKRVGSKTSGLNGGIVVAPTNASYIRIVFGSVGTAEYGHDICFNISDPKRNGTYEPYAEYRYPLDSSLTLRGVPKVVDGNICYDGDIYAYDGTVTRKYGTLDLGTKNWTRTTSYSEPFFYASTNDAAENAEAICSKYEYISNNGMTASRFPTVASDKMFSFSNNGTQIYIRDDSYTDAATFKTALSGVMLVYKLATPTTETATPYQHLQIVDAGGTEEYVTTGLVPVGHNTKYPTDLVAKLDGLPSDFSTLIAPTEAQMVATRNYNTGEFLIVNNVLYKTTSAIASGAAITVGTNVTATTIAEQLIALLNS